MTRQLKEALRKQKKQTKQEILQIPGSLGITIGGQRRVEVPNRNSFVYVRLRDNQNELIQAFNNKVAPSYGLPVIVERQGNRYVVTSVDSLRYNNNYNSFAPFLPRHGNTHSFDPETGGGGDPTWIYSRQMMPALIMPSGSDGGPNAVLNAYTIKNADGTWKYIGVTGTPNFTPYKPANNQAVMVLIYLDSLSGNPYLMVGSGSYFAGTITGSSAIVPYIPTLTNPNHIPLAAVRLVSGTNAVSWNNIYDVRQWIHTVPTGTGGAGSTGSFDSVYLRLDTSNNPLTDILRIINNNDGNGGLYISTVGDAPTAHLDQYGTVSGTITNPLLSVNRILSTGTSVDSPLAYFSQTDDGGLPDNSFLTYVYNGNTLIDIDRRGSFSIYPDLGMSSIVTQVIGDAYSLYLNQLPLPSGTLSTPDVHLGRSQYDDTGILNTSFLSFFQTWNLSDITSGKLLTFESNSVERIFIDPSAQGTGTMTMLDGDFSLSDNGNLLLLKTNGSPRTKIAAQGNIELGLNKTKEVNAGKIGYELFGSNYLYIVGAGAASNDRRVQIYDKLYVSDLVEASSFNITNPAQTYNITGSPHTHSYIPTDGWEQITATWTRTGNHTFTVSGDLTAIYRKGTKVKYNDGGIEYGVVGSSSHAAGTTTVNLIVNSDYAMSASPSTRYISYIENPDGFPHWFNYAATLYGSGGSAGSYAEDFVNQYFAVYGRSIHVLVSKRITNKGSWTGNVGMLRPVAPLVNSKLYKFSAVIIPDASVTPRGIYELGSANFESLVAAAFLQWSSMAVNDWVIVEMIYPF